MYGLPLTELNDFMAMRVEILRMIKMIANTKQVSV